MKSIIFSINAKDYIDELSHAQWSKKDEHIEVSFAGYRYIFHWLGDTMLCSIYDILNDGTQVGVAYLNEEQGIEIENYVHDLHHNIGQATTL